MEHKRMRKPYSRAISNPLRAVLRKNAEDIVNYAGYVRVRENPGGRDEYIPLKAIVRLPSSYQQARRNDGYALSSADVGDYGRKMNADSIKNVLTKMMLNNVRLAELGRPTIPICIWGSHGLGKTTIVRDICAEPDKHWDYAYVAPAQFEEMGDLHGFPVRVGSDGAGVMKYFPPEWVPTSEPVTAGVLLMDDITRADPRIQNGLMQLFQDGRLAGWQLPRKYMIIATANPASSGDYSVGELDPAQMTRMLHVEMIFEMGSWVRWAQTVDPKDGQPRVDKRCVDWMKAHGGRFLQDPEKYKRTTPRSLDQFFTQISHIKDWAKNIDLLQTYAYAALDKEVADDFLINGIPKKKAADESVIAPQDILFAPDIKDAITQFNESIYDDEGNKRTDLIHQTVESLLRFIDANLDSPDLDNPYTINYELLDQASPEGKSVRPMTDGRPTAPLTGAANRSPISDKIMAAYQRNRLARRNFTKFLLNPHFPAEQALKVLDHMRDRVDVIKKSDGSPVVDKFDPEQGYINIEGTRLPTSTLEDGDAERTDQIALGHKVVGATNTDGSASTNPRFAALNRARVLHNRVMGRR
jgi:hypothetical protein